MLISGILKILQQHYSPTIMQQIAILACVLISYINIDTILI